MRLYTACMAILCVSLFGSFAWAELPKAAEADRYMLEIEQAYSGLNFVRMDEFLTRLEGLDMDKPDEYHFYRGVAFAKASQFEAALSAYETYVKAVGREGEHYDDALSAITQLEERMVASKSSESAPVALSSNILSDTKPGEQFDAKVKSLYPHSDFRDALVEYVNSLLLDNLYMEGAVKNRASSRQIRYKLGWNKTGDLILNKTVVNPKEATSTTEVERLAVYGVNPEIRSSCVAASCWLLNPSDGSDWIRLSADSPSSITELKLGIERLVKHMQRQ